MRDGKNQILRLLDENDLWLTPGNIAYNIDLSQGYVRKECYSLWEKELLFRDAEETNPFYSICLRGRLALELNRLEIEYTYRGHHPDPGTWEVIVEPADMRLSEAGEQFFGEKEISWGADGGDTGAFHLAQNLLRHAVGPDAADRFAFQYYKEVTSGFDTTFERTESDIRDWVHAKESPNQHSGNKGARPEKSIE